MRMLGCIREIHREEFHCFDLRKWGERIVQGVGFEAPIFRSFPRNSSTDCRRARSAETWSSNLSPNGQPIYAHRAKWNLGFAGGVNVSIRQFQHERGWSAFWLLNPDTEPAPGALRALVARARDGVYSIVGSRILLQSTRRVQLYGGYWRPFIGRGFNIGLDAAADADVDIARIESRMTYVSGASLLAVRKFIEEVGLMREDYFLYAEDVDWCLRRGNHHLGYAHDSIVYHTHGSTIGSGRDRRKRSRLSVYLDERNKLLLTRRFFPYFFPIAMFTTLFLTMQYLRVGAVTNFFVAISGWFAGVRGEVGPPPGFIANVEASN